MDASHQSQKPTRTQTSRWGRRKSVRDVPGDGARSSSSLHQIDKGKAREHTEQQDPPPTQPLPTWAPVPSIVPDPLLDLPAWYHSDVFEWSAATAVQFRRKYPLHNPVGPRWYRNHHLIPPSVIHGNRAPSVFSPLFPPISVSGHDRPEHTMSLPVPVRTPSSSPSPSPNTSQVQVNDSAPTRTRKVSHTGPGADSLDASDPSGINFHHSSPYDIGLNRERHVHTQDPPEVRGFTHAVCSNPDRDGSQSTYDPRSRRPSSVQAQRHKTVTPSPLSQSTSAVHLQADSEGVGLPRKLSKRRTGIRGVFNGHAINDVAPKSVSAPATPMDGPVSNLLTPPPADGAGVRRKLSKRESVRPSIAGSLVTVEKREKRGSILGRLAKKFTIMRKPNRESRIEATEKREDEWQDTSGAPTGTTTPAGRESSPEKGAEPRKSGEMTRRVPPPAVNTTNAAPRDLDALYAGLRDQKAAQEAAVDRSSMSVLDAPYSIGRLTIANPDAPSSTENSPAPRNVPLPALSQQVEQVAPSSAVAPTPEQPRSSPPAAPTPVGTANSDAAPAPTPVPNVTSPRPPSPMLPEIPQATSPISEAASPPMIPSEAGAMSPVEHGAFTMMSIPSEVSVTSPLPPAAVLSAAPWANDSPNDSPLSRASMLANPPTPHPPTVPIPPATAPVPTSSAPVVPPIMTDNVRSVRTSSPKKPSQEERQRKRSPSNGEDAQSLQSPREESPTKMPKSSGSTRSMRQTETFRLVRSPSGGNVPTVDAIMANGEQWAVVEGGHKRSRTKDRPKSKEESGGHKESRREKRRSEQEAEARAANVHASGSRSSIPAEMMVREDVREREHHQRSTHDVSRRRSRDIPRGDSRGASQDLNALKAREAWEMERLFRGRSFYQPEQPESMRMPSPEPAQPNGYHHQPMAYPAQVGSGYPATLGSSHTSYVMQAPFQTAPQSATAYYAVPPPVIYHQPPYNPQDYASQRRSVSPRDDVLSHHSYPDPSSLDLIPSEAGSPPPRTNPLPAPPRQSSYKPPPISPTHPEGTSPELNPQYWKSYAGLAAH
ncbi:hypothetical protein PUNSTDRAFT_110172 [Punctularia strigosozonata HHB-11173 SS5]|uniref:uncharacterized protein n=1 Tax=Punctularia strigosozonata (strain HHB-11173) TaxID=741275 RepID=UPI0004416530|nr:uncharacterized protein PUNSTDRAFT_110172 [Punctularia strigosozonata HHB-11173 SS5]EIN14032.1 hypothetical protein PUNSTDRAFT_110172 [Punctularia strigosozonata HHB-11173 SS5]